MKRDEDAEGWRGWREMAGLSGEEVLVKSGEEEKEVGESERAGFRWEEEDGGAKVFGRKGGEREGLARSFCREGREGRERQGANER